MFKHRFSEAVVPQNLPDGTNASEYLRSLGFKIRGTFGNDTYIVTIPNTLEKCESKEQEKIDPTFRFSFKNAEREVLFSVHKMDRSHYYFVLHKNKDLAA